MDELTEDNQQQKLSNLQFLELSHLPELRWIFRGPIQNFSFQSLKVAKVEDCDELTSLFSSTHIQSLVLLEELEIWRCDKLMKGLFMELESDDKTESNSYPNPELCLPKLKTLRIFRCSRLEYVLPISLSQGLPKLELVWVRGCPQLEQVWGSVAKEQDGVEHVTVLPRLRYVGLETLTTLSSFGPENYIFKAPSLEDLTVSECPRLTNFTIPGVRKNVDLKGVRLSTFKESLSKTEALTLNRINVDHKNMASDANLEGLTTLYLKDCKDVECLVDTTKDHVPTSGIFPNLVELEMRNMIDFEMFCKGQTLRGFLRNLEILKVSECGDIVSLSPVEQNLKKLEVVDCEKLQQAFRIDELLLNREVNHKPLLSNLSNLRLWAVPELNWILKGPTHFVSLRSLEIVDISSCNKLKSVFSPSVSRTLTLLEELRINGCDELENVFSQFESADDQTESNTLCFPNLKILQIEQCQRLEYVFPVTLAQQGLPRLRRLWLHHLTNLNHFVAENYFVQLPALKILDVNGCPLLTNFTIQRQVVVDKPIQLKRLELITYIEQRDDEESCNTQMIQRSPNLGKFEQFQLQGGYFISSLEEVKLAHVIWLRDIWTGPIQVVTNLRKLELWNFSGLTYIFPLMHMQNFPQLTVLHISYCENLKQIIGTDNSSASSSQGHDQDKTSIKHEKELLMFSLLTEVKLSELPSLVSFGPVGYHSVFPSLHLLNIEGCSQMTTSFSVDSSLAVHATEAFIHPTLYTQAFLI